MPHARVNQHDYLACPTCSLVWLHPAQRPDTATERAYYDTHENDPADTGYRRFLAQLAEPLTVRLPAGANGLDFGSGPGPTLSVMLEEQGFPTRIYDPFFAPDTAALESRYDFITCTEAAEHFFHPGKEFARLDRLLRPGGHLAVMTAFRPADSAFATWHYLRDPTHVCFYSPATMEWIAAHYDWSLEIPARNVALLRKPPATLL